jgi:hypothetical protein
MQRSKKRRVGFGKSQDKVSLKRSLKNRLLLPISAACVIVLFTIFSSVQLAALMAIFAR